MSQYTSVLTMNHEKYLFFLIYTLLNFHLAPFFVTEKVNFSNRFSFRLLKTWKSILKTFYNKEERGRDPYFYIHAMNVWIQEKVCTIFFSQDLGFKYLININSLKQSLNYLWLSSSKINNIYLQVDWNIFKHFKNLY